MSKEHKENPILFDYLLETGLGLEFEDPSFVKRDKQESDHQ